MKRPLGAQISYMLKARGVDVIFGIPGVHNQEMYRGIEEAGIRHVLARHEQGAGFMADGYARATGKPGVAYVITGPGLCNAMTPMGQAFSDSVPMIVISSALDEVAATKGQLHQMKDQRVAAETVCDWSEEARTADAAYDLINRAFTELQLGRPRPKHIQVPIKLLEALAPQPPMPAHSGEAGGRGYDSRVAQEIASALKAARKPLMIVGGGARDAAGSCVDLADRVGMAVFCTYAGRGIMPANHPLFFGSMLARPDSARVLAEGDLLFVVGSEMAQVDFWREAPGHDCPVIRIDIDPAQLPAARQHGDMPVLGDSCIYVDAVLDALGEIQGATDWNANEIATIRARWRREIDAERPGILPICAALQRVLPNDVMIFSDMTQFAYAAKEIWDMPQPGHWHHPYGFGTLGYATPAAIGGAVARPGLPTMAIIGDYGFHYTMQELGVAVELGLSLPILLWDNGKLKEIEESMVRAQIAPNAVIARNPDFCKLAEAFGARAAAPASLAELQSTVTEAFSAGVPTLIHVTPGIVAKA